LSDVEDVTPYHPAGAVKVSKDSPTPGGPLKSGDKDLNWALWTVADLPPGKSLARMMIATWVISSARCGLPLNRKPVE